jgi:hypothetical protein
MARIKLAGACRISAGAADADLRTCRKDEAATSNVEAEDKDRRARAEKWNLNRAPELAVDSIIWIEHDDGEECRHRTAKALASRPKMKASGSNGGVLIPGVRLARVRLSVSNVDSL